MTILSMFRSQISHHQILNWDSVILMSPTKYQVLAHLLWQNNLREKKKKKSLSATALNSTVLRLLRSTVELTIRSQLKKIFVSVAGLTMEL